MRSKRRIKYQKLVQDYKQPPHLADESNGTNHSCTNLSFDSCDSLATPFLEPLVGHFTFPFSDEQQFRQNRHKPLTGLDSGLPNPCQWLQQTHRSTRDQNTYCTPLPGQAPSTEFIADEANDCWLPQCACNLRSRDFSIGINKLILEQKAMSSVIYAFQHRT